MNDRDSCFDYNHAFLTAALREDIGGGDLTTSALVPEGHTSVAVVIAKEPCVVAGLPAAVQCFACVDGQLKVRILKKDGSPVRKGDVIARVRGKTGSILMAERVALNLLQRLSGIATLTNRFVVAVKGTGASIVDTRKTTPGLRHLEKYAVKVGGGRNHRFGLFDGVLIKDNHIAAVGSVGRAVKMARSAAQHLLKIEVEVSDMKGVREALAAGAEAIMLDNMSLETMKKSVALIRKQRPETIVEASGNITLDNVRPIAETGVDIISVGVITHSARAADMSLRISHR